MPFTLESKALEVDVEQAERLLHDEAGALRAWYLPASFERVELDHETLGVMRALGYIQ